MNVRELKAHLESLERRHGDDEVVVSIDSPSLGFHAAEKVKSISAGFDWDKGRVFIRCENPIVVKSDKQALWDAVHDFMFQLSGDARSYRGVSKPSALADRARSILRRFGMKVRKLNSWTELED